MSHYKDDQSPNSSLSSPGGHHQYGNYPAPGYSHQQFYPPLPPLPPPNVPPQHGINGIHHHHGYVPHHYDGFRGTAHHYDGYSSHHSEGFAQQSSTSSHGGAPSPGGGYVDAGSHHGEPPVVAKPPLALDVSPPLTTNEPSSFRPPTTDYARPETSPYFLRPPTLPPAASTVSPNDVRQTNPAAVYRNSPYFSEAPALDIGSGSSESSASSTANRPVPARSAFMCFSEAKGKEISRNSGDDGGKGGFVETVAAEWRGLSKQDKSHWDDMAKGEKKRFAKEKQAYKGPLSRKLRAKKNPLAPKRPMSAFLMYAQQRRRPLQKENPDLPNADISRLLGELWRNAPATEKRPFLEREEVERKIYKARMEAWKNDEKLAKSLKSRAVAPKGGARKKLDKELDGSSFSNEESHPNQRYDHRTQNSEASYPVYAPMPSHQQTGVYAEDHADSPPSYHEHKFDATTWPPPYHREDSGHHVKYTYPRPQEDRYE